jgi:hypothetical protein
MDVFAFLLVFAATPQTVFSVILKITAKYFVLIHVICAVCFHTYCLSKPTKIEM